MASAQAAISTAPAPPNKWPVIDLVELIETVLRVLAENSFDRARFANVAEAGRGGVRVDVINLARV